MNGDPGPIGSVGSRELPPRGRTELGAIIIADRVVSKIAARAASENPNAGAPATRLLGMTVPGASRFGGQTSDIDGLPRATVQVDGGSAFVDLTISVRWPTSVAHVAAQTRDHVTERVQELTGLAVQEVHITVADLVTDIAVPSRVH